MSHHSVESMRDVAFRKGRHGFDSDDDYLRALRGEELEDEFPDEEDEEEDEPLPGGEDIEDDNLRAIADFEDTIFDVISEASNRTVNRIFDWIMEVENGKCPAELTFLYRSTTVKMSVVDKSLKFELARSGGATSRGLYDYGFEDFLDAVQDLLMNREFFPYCAVCDTVKNVLDAGRLYYGENCVTIWKIDIARLMASPRSQGDLELRAKHGEEVDMRLRFIRRSPTDGDTLWVLLNPVDEDMLLDRGDGHPIRLLQWLFKINGLIDETSGIDEPLDDET